MILSAIGERSPARASAIVTMEVRTAFAIAGQYRCLGDVGGLVRGELLGDGDLVSGRVDGYCGCGRRSEADRHL